ncbi:helix-turn-helix domain-containing protein [Sphingopyxis sp. RIFCSPHIGHO2_12_FULL_65_19]|uniref:helix-turn-helix domain-containing protein n=1 Tax=Sphingopyxis sp. RIFCSPHIGHO2_12_FULL_65_19 TaxID=1802172 RepID=UPI0008D505D2|nr:helix-turn-helix transcriptional regulator [Sphingopyxis sp. RIFCSPHIGHO2_12_FULL_65_19]OHD09123.1 MAG: transcriptional regulator [Sphingopyxis sp. RIFCSPHIGHO2_12_FULL_65_19]
MKPAPLGEQLREWRVRRRMSQMDLALDSEISTRHLSFIETGRSRPSAAMLQRIADCLEVPHRARNALLLAGGYAPDFQERALDSEEMAGMKAIVEHVLKGHEPYPAIAVDRHWNMIAANDAVELLIRLAAPELFEPPVNVLRVALHPRGLAPHIVNHAEWRAHLLERLDHQVDASADAGLIALREELAAYPASADAHHGSAANGIAVPLILDTPLGEVRFVSTVTIFGTPVDITLSELAIEAFFPADAESAALLQRMAGG